MNAGEQVSLAIEVTRLADEAKARVRDGDPAAAVWRLVDAAFLAWKLAGSPDDLIGCAIPTGRGARLVEET